MIQCIMLIKEFINNSILLIYYDLIIFLVDVKFLTYSLNWEWIFWLWDYIVISDS